MERVDLNERKRELGSIHHNIVYGGFFFLSLFSSGSLSAFSQERVVSSEERGINLHFKNEKLSNVFKVLEKESGYKLVYSNKDIEGFRFNGELKAGSFQEALHILCRPYAIDYSIQGRTVTIRLPDVATRTVKGIVLDDGGAPIIGATIAAVVKDKGTVAYKVTDTNGLFEILAPTGSVLKVSSIGFEEKNVRPNFSHTMKIVLYDNSHQLDELVVTGYQTIDKRKTTSAISSVKMDDVLTPGMMTIDQALEGRIPDLMYLSNSGEAGATARLRVRGTSTLVGNREPLWVLDGFVLQDPVNVTTEQLNDPDYVNYIGNAISGLNPQDIDRITVLKDASATALYGTRAANGVIVITTKKGKSGPPTVTYSSQFKFVRRPRYTDNNINLMNSQERVQFGKDLVDLHYAFPSGMPMVGYEGAYYRYQTGVTSYDEFLKEVRNYETVNTDWFKLLTRDALTQSHTLSISGGSNNIRYYTSLGVSRENGVIKTEYVNRYTASMNIMANISRSLRANFNLNGNVRKQNHLPGDVSALDYAYNTTRALPAYNADGSYFWYKDKPYSHGEGKSYEKYNYNILNEINNVSDDYDGNTLIASADLNYSLKNILDLTAAASYSRSSTDQATWYGEKSNYVAILKNGEVDDRPLTGESGKSELPYGGVLNTAGTTNESFTGRLQANFHYALERKGHQHLFTSTVGYEVNTVRVNGLNDQTRGYYKDRGMKYVTMDANALDNFPLYKEWLANGHRTVTSQKTNSISGYMTIAYDYDNFFTLSASGRFDASNKFGSRSNEKFLPVWSVSGRWNIKRTFFKDSDTFDDLSLRSSFGKTGNMLDGETPNLLLKQGTLDAFYGENTSTVYRFPNPNLRWEQTRQTNIGFDLSMYGGRLTFSTDVWYKKTTDAFASVNVSPINGVTNYNMNNGTIKNHGFSFSLSGYPIRTRDWKLYLSTNYSWSSNVVQSKTSEIYTLADYLNGTAIVEGKSIGTFYAYKFLGLNPRNGLPMFDDYSDRKYLLEGLQLSQIIPLVMEDVGNREPKFSGAFFATLTWKQLSLNMNFTYSLGSKIRLFPLYSPILSGISAGNNVRKEFIDRWMVPGDEKRTNIPSLLSPADPDYLNNINHWSTQNDNLDKVVTFANNIWDMYDQSDLRVVPGDYLRLSSLTLSYNMQSAQLRGLPLKSLRLSLSAANVFTIASKKLRGQDPSQANNEKAVLSIRPSYTLSINVSF